MFSSSHTSSYHLPPTPSFSSLPDARLGGKGGKTTWKHSACSLSFQLKGPENLKRRFERCMGGRMGMSDEGVGDSQKGEEGCGVGVWVYV